MNLIKWLLKVNLQPTVDKVTRILKDAPICHDKPMDFISESIGFKSVKTYQCETCKRIQSI
jgi:hypothetical protein